MTIAGKYDMISSDKYDEFLKVVGVGVINRGLANKAKPTIEFIDHGNNKWTQKTSTTLKKFEITFVIGEEFDETTADDRKSKSTVTIDGNKLTHKQKVDDEVAVTVREFKDDEMICTFSAKNVVATRVFKKVA